MGKKTRIDWVVCDSERGGVFVCKRCGAEHRPDYPIPFLDLAKLLKAFGQLHSLCKAPQRSPFSHHNPPVPEGAPRKKPGTL